MEKHYRKLNKLKNFDYSSNGLYFVTFCTKGRVHYLSEILYDDPFECVNGEYVGNAALGVPFVKFTEYGEIVNDNIKKINEIYEYVSVIDYVIMHDHVHMVLFVSDFDDGNCGTPGAAFPTKSVSMVINALKSISTKKIGFSIWQKSFHDHIIRNENEFLEICEYIDNNPINWVNHIYNRNFWR